MLLTLVIACFTLSGFAALLYQTAWMRLFAIAFGTSEIAVAVVLAGYMVGLAIGAAVAARYVNRITRPVLVYGILEGAIAIAALALPLLVDVSGQLYAYFVGGQPVPPDASTFGQSLYYSIASFLVLLVPTALMGATLPLLARYAVTSDRNLGSRVSALYSMNTFGAVGGTLVAGFVLLPALGLRGTVWVGVLVNGLVFILAVVLARYAGNLRDVSGPESEQKEAHQGINFILPMILLSGVLSFVYEVLWTRMLSHLLGSSIYAFATMLSAFLAGIAIGAAGAGLLARDPQRATRVFAVCQFGIALASAFIYWRIEQSLPLGIGYAAIAFAVILPSTIFIGATYPLAVRAYAGNVADVGRASAIVYSWNTVGSIVGAIGGGFFIIPMLGFAGTAQLAVMSNVLIGLLVLILCARRSSWPALPRWQLAGGVVVLIGLAVAFNPQRPDGLISRAIFGGSGEQLVREVHYSVGRSSTVLMTENRARFDLSTNGLPEAQIEFKGAPPVVLSQRWLGMWPALARPEADSMLVVGLGGGVVLEGVPASIETLHVVELEAGVVEANRLIGDRREIDPLANEQLHLVVNDARNALRLTSRTYDAIVSQPSHPWTAGASHLFTREFFGLVKSRLNEDGVFVQWMNAEFLDEELLRRLVATLLSEFRNVRIYQPSSLALHFIASDGPLDIERELGATGKPILDDPEHYSRNGLNGPADLVAAMLVDESGARTLAGDHGLITDDDNRMAVDSNVLALGLGVASLTKITRDVDPLLDADSWLRRALSDTDLAYVAWRLLYDGQVPRTKLLAETISDESSRSLLRAMIARAEGRHTQAAGLLETIGPSSPVYEQVVFLQTVDHLPAIALGEFNFGDVDMTSEHPSRFAAVLAGWRALGAQDWRRLFDLEQALRMTRVSDLWAPQAARLQAEWRLRADDPDGSYGREALALIDASIAAIPTLETYAIRARIGRKLGDSAVLIESVAFMLSEIHNRLWYVDRYGRAISDPERHWITRQLGMFGAHLRELLADDKSGRANIVLAQLVELEQLLEAY